MPKFLLSRPKFVAKPAYRSKSGWLGQWYSVDAPQVKWQYCSLVQARKGSTHAAVWLASGHESVSSKQHYRKCPICTFATIPCKSNILDVTFLMLNAQNSIKAGAPSLTTPERAHSASPDSLTGFRQLLTDVCIYHWPTGTSVFISFKLSLFARNLVSWFLGKYSKIVATKCHSLSLKCTKIDFGKIHSWI